MVKHSVCQWLGHLQEDRGDLLTNTIYKSGVNAVGVRGRLPIKWDGSAGILVGERG